MIGDEKNIGFSFLLRIKLFSYISIVVSARSGRFPKTGYKTLGRARDPRANGAWLNKLTE